MPEFTAVFPTVASATSYFEALQAPGNWVTNVARKGRTVTFDRAIPAEYADEASPYYFGDQLERVGYYGSTQRRKATLNGVPAPFAW